MMGKYEMGKGHRESDISKERVEQGSWEKWETEATWEVPGQHSTSFSHCE